MFSSSLTTVKKCFNTVQLKHYLLGLYALFFLGLIFYANYQADYSQKVSLRPNHVEQIEPVATDIFGVPTQPTYDGFTHILRYDLTDHIFKSSLIKLKINGCLQDIFLNERIVDINHLDSKARCENDKYIHVQLGQIDLKEKHSLKVFILDKEKPRITIRFDGAAKYSYLFFITLLSACFTIFFFYKRQNNLALLHLLLTASAVFFWFMFKSNPGFSSIDGFSHIHYVNFMADHEHIPGPKRGWIFYHPPFYYMIAGFQLQFGRWLDFIPPIDVVRSFSILCYLGFLCAGLMAIWRWLDISFLPRIIGSVLLVFWPLGAMAASWVDAHVFLYLFASWCFFFMLMWVKTSSYRYVMLAVIFCSLAIASRSNAYVLLPFMACCGLYHIILKQINWRSFFHYKYLILILPLALGALANNYRNIEMRLDGHRGVPWVVGNARAIVKAPQYVIPNELEHYITMDLRKFFSTTHYIPERERSGKLNFWTSMIKSSMFSRVKFNDQRVARIMLHLLLGLWLLLVIPMLSYKRHDWRYMIVPWAFLLSSIAGLMYLRYSVPVSTSQNFRYIYPAIIPFVMIISYHLEIMKKYKIWPLFSLSALLCLSFSLGSIYIIFDHFFEPV